MMMQLVADLRMMMRECALTVTVWVCCGVWNLARMVASVVCLVVFEGGDGGGHVL